MATRTAPVIRIAYAVYTPESVEAGGAEETGWHDEEGHEIDPWWEDGQDYITEAASFLESQYVEYASSSPWSKGAWYTNPKWGEDIATGEVEEHTYHLDGFTEAEELAIYNLLKERKVIS